MKSLLNAFALTLVILFGASANVAQAKCTPKFINPITDVCWTCIFPITLLGLEFSPSGIKPTGESRDFNSFICNCNLNVGIPVSFWEPVRSVDVVKDPYCFLNLGFQINDADVLPFDVQGSVNTINSGGKEFSVQKSFYHVHYYTNPMLYWLELLLENPCIERGGFDLGYLTEADPSWSDPALAGIFNPDAFLYGNIVAVAACTADCISATTADKSIDFMHWCSGCNGTVYPLTGHFNQHHSGVSTASVLTQRMLTKAHRLGGGLAFGSSGKDGLCGYYASPMIKKSDYKFQVTHPFPQDKRITGKCCQPFGTSSQLFGVGKNVPVIGEDYGFLIFRKRDCCNALITPDSFGGVTP